MSESLAIDGGTPVRTKPFGPIWFFEQDDADAVSDVVLSGSVAKGPIVAAFERAFAERHGVQHAITATSGTAAMHVCIGALNPDPGDEVIVTPWTSGGTFIGALFQNCVPVFADVDDTYNLDPADVEAKITSRTRAIIAVHLSGNPCDMDALRDIARRHHLYLIEDCCQAPFAEYQGQIVGSLSDIAGFSFGGKHLSAGGGGIVLTDNRSLWERALIFSDCGLPRDGGPYEGRPYANYFLAPNYKMTDTMAALLLSQLKKVDGYIERKIYAAEQIKDRLSDIEEISFQKVRPGDRHTYWVLGFTIDTDKLTRDAWEFADAVTAEGISLNGPYSGSGKEGPAYRNPWLAEPNLYGSSRFPLDYGRERPVDYRQAKCPYGEALMGRSVRLLMRPSLSEEDIDDISTAIRKVLVNSRRPVDLMAH